MDNYPDNIRDFKCPVCKELVPNCVCEEVDAQQRYKDALHGDSEDTYYEMFDSADSDEVVKLIRKLHQDTSEENAEALVALLDSMLVDHTS